MKILKAIAAGASLGGLLSRLISVILGGNLITGTAIGIVSGAGVGAVLVIGLRHAANERRKPSEN